MDVTSEDGAPGDRTADGDAIPWGTVAALVLPAVLLPAASPEVPVAAAGHGANAVSAAI